MWRGAPGKWSGLHPAEPGGLLEKPLADWRGRALQALPTKSFKDRCQNTSAPKARRGAAGNEPQEDLGEGGLRDRRRGRGVGGRAADPAGPAPSTMLSAPLHPRAAHPAPACAPLLLPPGAHRSAAAAQGPAASPPLPPCEPRRAAPGTRGFGFQAAELRFAPPAGSTRPPGPGARPRNFEALALRLPPPVRPRRRPGRRPAPQAQGPAPRPAPLSSLTPLPPPPPRPATFLPHFFPRPASEQPRPAALCLALTLSVLPLFPWKPLWFLLRPPLSRFQSLGTSVSISLSIPSVLSDSPPPFSSQTLASFFLLTFPSSNQPLRASV